MNEDEIQKTIEDVWSVYHDIQILEDMGFVPIGYPAMNPDDIPDDPDSLERMLDYNRAIVLMRFGPRESVLTAKPCKEEIDIRVGNVCYIMPRAFIHCGKAVDECISSWMADNVPEVSE